MFAVLEIETDPLSWYKLPGALHEWLEAVGGFAILGLIIWLIFWLINPPPPSQRKTGLTTISWLLWSTVLAIVIGLLPIALAIIWDRLGLNDPSQVRPVKASWTRHLDIAFTSTVSQSGAISALGSREKYLYFLYYVASSWAIAAVMLPFLLGLTRLRFRRIWGLAKLSFKEAIRRRVLWAFSALILVFLFASWFISHKPEDQVRGYVGVVSFVITWLLVITAGLLASFSIPNDMKYQTIHTIVTKPVERFEIVLGRFLGFTMLMSLVLAVMTLLSLIYIARGVVPEAAEESFKARVPVYGNLKVQSYRDGRLQEAGKSVGREYAYRTYISGGNSEERATWIFPNLPPDLANRPDDVRCEFGFDIFRTSKGKFENKGVQCRFTFITWKCPAATDPREEAKVSQEFTQTGGAESVAREFAREKGFYEIKGKEVVDYHTLGIEVPRELFQDLADWKKQKSDVPPLTIVVRLEDLSQLLGVAKYDLYLLEKEGRDNFWQNFFKGAVGTWFNLSLIIVLGVTFSTYLSGIISWAVTMVLYVGGVFVAFVRDVASGSTTGGGPLEAIVRITGSTNIVSPLDESSTSVKFALAGDKVTIFLLRRILNLLPDLSRFDMTDYVAQGFDISIFFRDDSLALRTLLLVAYLLPWAVLAFYMIRSREIATT